MVSRIDEMQTSSICWVFIGRTFPQRLIDCCSLADAYADTPAVFLKEPPLTRSAPFTMLISAIMHRVLKKTNQKLRV